MIATSTGRDVIALLERVTSRPERFKEVVVCSPFLDESMRDRLVQLLQSGRRAQCAVQFITAGPSADMLRRQLPGHAAFWRDSIVTLHRLHAKVYFAVARCAGESEAIVTSANLTVSGTVENVELGIRILPSSDSGRRVLQQVRDFVRRVAA